MRFGRVSPLQVSKFRHVRGRYQEEIEAEFSLTIYRLRELNEIENLSDRIDELRYQGANVTLMREDIPAVVGELAGIATKILLSTPAQALVNLVAIGNILWDIIKLVKNAGKRMRIGKKLVKPLIVAKAMESIESQLENATERINRAKVFGPMEAEPEAGAVKICYESWDQAMDPVAYFMALALPIPRGRVKTLWYLLCAGGDLVASWQTQTFSERVLDFFTTE